MGYSYADLEGLWVKAGGNPSAAPVAAAVALAESAGNPTSHNGNASTGDDSWGLWQINMIGSLGPARRAQYNLPNNQALTDPLTNARVAVAMSNNGANWAPWSTFKSGAFRRYMQGGVPPNLNVSGAGGAGNAGTPNGAQAQTASVVSDVLGPLLALLANIGNYIYMGTIIAGGGFFILVGAVIIARSGVADTAITLGKATIGATGTVGRGARTTGRIASAPVRRPLRRAVTKDIAAREENEKRRAAEAKAKAAAARKKGNP